VCVCVCVCEPVEQSNKLLHGASNCVSLDFKTMKTGLLNFIDKNT
jgi:hypothetical protein